MTSKIRELAKHLDISTDEIITSAHCEKGFDVGSHTYLVLTDAEADDACAEYIRESLWAFNATFLVDYVPDGLTAEHLELIRGDRCEDFNEPILALVKAGAGFDECVSGAISADGRGAFLSAYDGEEHETENFFIYQMD